MLAKKMRAASEPAGCTKLPCFDVPDSKEGMFCSEESEHKVTGMVEQEMHPCCMKPPVFNVPVSKMQVLLKAQGCWHGDAWHRLITLWWL